MPEIQSIEYSQDYFIEIEKKLRKKLTEKRYRHTLGVANTAANMAMVHGEDVSRAYLAGLLHDNAKCIDSDKKIRLCEKYGLSISKTERENPELLMPPPPARPPMPGARPNRFPITPPEEFRDMMERPEPVPRPYPGQM